MGIIVRLDRVMSNRKIKLLELADKIGITYANLSNLKNSKVTAIRFSTLESLCRELNCQPGDILEYLDDEVTEFINIITNTEEEKEGALNRIYAYAATKGQKNITLELAKECFGFLIKNNIDIVVNKVSSYFKTTKENILLSTNEKDIYIKQLAIYLCKSKTSETFKSISDYFNIDALEIISICDKISEELTENKSLQEDYNSIVKELN